MQVVRHRSGASVSPVIKFIITGVALAAVSLVIALLWQNAQEDKKPPGPEKKPSSAEPLQGEPDGKAVDSGLTGIALPADKPVPASGASSSEIEASSDAPQADADAAALPQGEETAYARSAVPGAAPLNDKTVEYDYFEDAIFFGDSISTGIPLYMKTMVPGAAVVAMQGINTLNVNTSECIDIDGKKLTMLDAAKTKGERKKVYIMLGSNGLDLEEKSFIEGYSRFVASVKELYPGAVIYVQSMLPVTVNVNQVYPNPNINNQRISQYNTAVCKMARDQGVHYVDVAQCMVDETGALPVKASPFDGMHLMPEYYIKWFDYLRSHTVS